MLWAAFSPRAAIAAISILAPGRWVEAATALLTLRALDALIIKLHPSSRNPCPRIRYRRTTWIRTDTVFDGTGLAPPDVNISGNH
ncbi:hypothetical protein M885DRAFT_540847, partial [Pelagophyceae sp. CCMP2097]